MQSAGRLVGVVVKFAARMKRCQNDTLRRHACLMHTDGDATSVILYRAGSVRLQRHTDGRAVTGQVLIYGVIHNLIDEVVQSSAAGTANIHAGTHPDSLKALEHTYAFFTVFVAICHKLLIPLLLYELLF